MDETSLPPATDIAQPPTPPPSAGPERNEILYGPNGLRAGWRALIFLAIVVAIVFLINVTGHYLTRKYGHSPVNPGQMATATLTPGLIAIGELTSLAVILVASLIMGRIEHRKLAHYGL